MNSQEAQQLQHEKEKVQLEEYLNHPVTQQVKRELEEQQESLMTILLDVPITDVESLVNHFEARGHLRGLKRSRAITAVALEEVNEKLKDKKI